MYRKRTILLLTSITLFVGCASASKALSDFRNKSSEGGDNTALQASIVGGVVIGGLSYLSSDKDGTTTLIGATGGAVGGYMIGRKLAKMQKRYKGEENELIANIIEIDDESKALEKKNLQLSRDIAIIEEKIELLDKQKSSKNREKQLLKSTLNNRKSELKKVLIQYQMVDKKIANSKSKISQYEYSDKDKKNLLKSVDILAKASAQSIKDIKKKLITI